MVEKFFGETLDPKKQKKNSPRKKLFLNAGVLRNRPKEGFFLLRNFFFFKKKYFFLFIRKNFFWKKKDFKKSTGDVYYPRLLNQLVAKRIQSVHRTSDSINQIIQKDKKPYWPFFKNGLTHSTLTQHNSKFLTLTFFWDKFLVKWFPFHIKCPISIIYGIFCKKKIFFK